MREKNEMSEGGCMCVVEEMREKNEMSEGGCMCVVGEKKKERQGGYMVGGGKTKK